MDNTNNIQNRNVKVKVFENEEKNITQSITEANEWLKMSHMVVAYINIPGIGDRRTQVIVKFAFTFFGWKFKTRSSQDWYHITGFEKPKYIKLIKLYVDGQEACIITQKNKKYITSCYRDFMELYDENTDKAISADVILKETDELIHVDKLVRIDWEKREFDSEFYTVYKL